jgi:phosphoserine phosphatase
VPPEHIFGTRFRYHPQTGEIESIVRVPAGYGKVAVLDELQTQLQLSPDRVIYVGDGSSDVHVMLHVNRCDGFHRRGLREQIHRADCQTHDPQRRRLEPADPRAGRDRRSA